MPAALVILVALTRVVSVPLLASDAPVLAGRAAQIAELQVFRAVERRAHVGGQPAARLQVRLPAESPAAANLRRSASKNQASGSMSYSATAVRAGLHDPRPRVGAA